MTTAREAAAIRYDTRSQGFLSLVFREIGHAARAYFRPLRSVLRFMGAALQTIGEVTRINRVIVALTHFDTKH